MGGRGGGEERCYWQTMSRGLFYVRSVRYKRNGGGGGGGGGEGSSNVPEGILRHYREQFPRDTHVPFSPDDVGLSASALPLPLPDPPKRLLSAEEGVVTCVFDFSNVLADS